MKRLLVYSDCYIFGGSERLMASLIRNPVLHAEFEILMAYRSHGLYREGVRIEYSSEEQSKHLRPLLILANDTLFFRLNSLRLPNWLKNILKLPFMLIQKIGIYFLWNVIQFTLLLRNFKPEVLHINNGGYPGAASCTQLALAASWLMPNKCIYQVNNLAKPPRNRWDKMVDRRLARTCRFVTASKLAKDRLHCVRSIPNEALTQIFNTPPEESAMLSRAEFRRQWGLSNDTLVLSQVAFLSERKGQRYLLGALRLLKQQNPDLFRNIILFVVGQGEDFSSLKNLCSQWGLDANVRFVGYRKDSVEFIEHCDIFVLPSIAHEDMPLVVLSAMKCGKTIIASRFGGIEEEIEHGISGILVNPLPATLESDLANALQSQLLRPNLQLGVRAQERYNSLFSASAYGHALSRLYTQLNRNQEQK